MIIDDFCLISPNCHFGSRLKRISSEGFHSFQFQAVSIGHVFKYVSFPEDIRSYESLDSGTPATNQQLGDARVVSAGLLG